jgi:hypothetical protein
MRCPMFRSVLTADTLNSGSWLEIGQSISHFCITSLLLVFSAGIASIGEALMRGAVLRPPGREWKEHAAIDDIAPPRHDSGHSFSYKTRDDDITKR